MWAFIPDPNQQEGKKIRLDKGGNLNIFIAIDASESIEEDQFEKFIEVVKKLIEKVCCLPYWCVAVALNKNIACHSVCIENVKDFFFFCGSGEF